MLAFSAALLLASCSGSHSSSKGFTTDSFIGKLSAVKTIGNFIDAQAFSIDAFGNIYIVDAGGPGIVKFNQHGDSVRSIVALGREHDQFDGPMDVDASLTNSVAVADRNNHRIEIYSKDLIWQASIGGHEPGSKIQFGFPLAVRAAQAGNYFVIDGENKRLVTIQPGIGSQQIITTSGTESASEMNPLSLTLGGNEFSAVADASSGSLIVFNNAYLPQSQVRYSGVMDAKLFTHEKSVFAFAAKASVIRIFDADDLAYQGSLSLPAGTNHAIAIAVYKGSYYILTKEKIVVCSRD